MMFTKSRDAKSCVSRATNSMSISIFPCNIYCTYLLVRRKILRLYFWQAAVWDGYTHFLCAIPTNPHIYPTSTPREPFICCWASVRMHMEQYFAIRVICCKPMVYTSLSFIKAFSTLQERLFRPAGKPVSQCGKGILTVRKSLFGAVGEPFRWHVCRKTGFL